MSAVPNFVGYQVPEESAAIIPGQVRPQLDQQET